MLPSLQPLDSGQSPRRLRSEHFLIFCLSQSRGSYYFFFVLRSFISIPWPHSLYFAYIHRLYRIRCFLILSHAYHLLILVKNVTPILNSYLPSEDLLAVHTRKDSEQIHLKSVSGSIQRHLAPSAFRLPSPLLSYRQSSAPRKAASFPSPARPDRQSRGRPLARAAGSAGEGQTGSAARIAIRRSAFSYSPKTSLMILSISAFL